MVIVNCGELVKKKKPKKKRGKLFENIGLTGSNRSFLQLEAIQTLQLTQQESRLRKTKMTRKMKEAVVLLMKMEKCTKKNCTHGFRQFLVYFRAASNEPISSVRPEEVPDIPPNRFLFRGTVDTKEGEVQAENNTRNDRGRFDRTRLESEWSGILVLKPYFFFVFFFQGCQRQQARDVLKIWS